MHACIVYGREAERNFLTFLFATPTFLSVSPPPPPGLLAWATSVCFFFLLLLFVWFNWLFRFPFFGGLYRGLLSLSHPFRFPSFSFPVYLFIFYFCFNFFSFRNMRCVWFKASKASNHGKLGKGYIIKCLAILCFYWYLITEGSVVM
jgi:hypothetical protein